MFKKGFTLVELLVTISIIGILAGVITVSTMDARKKARDAKKKSDLNSIAASLEMYYAKNKTYFYKISGSPINTWVWGTMGNAIAPYITSFPNSSSDGTYGSGYVYYSDGKKFVLDCVLEGSGNENAVTITDPVTVPPIAANESSFYQSGSYVYSGKNHYRISSK